jgi:hypothetical protein
MEYGKTSEIERKILSTKGHNLKEFLFKKYINILSDADVGGTFVAPQ